MTKREAERQLHQENALLSLGFTCEEAEQLRRISMTLHRWHEKECGSDSGCIERDEATGKTYWYNSISGRRWPTPDRETGARKRLDRIIQRRDMECPENRDIRPEYAERRGNHSTEYFDDGKCLYCAQVKVTTYIQTDPRGAALYIIRPGNVPVGKDVSAYYSRGVCVY